MAARRRGNLEVEAQNLADEREHAYDSDDVEVTDPVRYQEILDKARNRRAVSATTLITFAGRIAVRLFRKTSEAANARCSWPASFKHLFHNSEQDGEQRSRYGPEKVQKQCWHYCGQGTQALAVQGRA